VSAVRWDEERVECTFWPEINEHSKLLMEELQRLKEEDPSYDEKARRKVRRARSGAAVVSPSQGHPWLAGCA
jgi:hypothetical protein